jgi:gamma-aminobutyric acid type B receptor
MALGSILATVGVILNAVPSPVETYSCQITVWFICFGFTLFFGALFAKTLRLVWIFFQIERLKSNPKQFIFKKTHLFLVLGGLLCIDLAILTTWTASDTLHAKSVQSDDDPLVYSILCRSSNDTIYVIVLATYKCILIGVTAILAFMARKLPNVLNESYFITMTVYNVALFTSIVLPVSAVLHDDVEASMIVRSIGILLCGVASVGLLVIPKMWVIFKGQHGAAEDDAIMDNLKVSKGSKGPTSNNQSASHPSFSDST